ncbi:MAG: hypothetical protein ORN98_05585, partial [Alphaproteobacteria bacterium]|nr:hypothetical protein [Alphaproteobacteria bacterium]
MLENQTKQSLDNPAMTETNLSNLSLAPVSESESESESEQISQPIANPISSAEFANFMEELSPFESSPHLL